MHFFAFFRDTDKFCQFGAVPLQREIKKVY